MTIELETGIQGEPQNPVGNEDVGAGDELQKPVFNQIQMQDAIKRERQKAYEKGQRDKLMELQTQQMPQEASQQQLAPQQALQSMQGQQQGLGGMQQMSMEQIERMISERAPLAVQQHVNQLKSESMVNTFVNKMQAAEQKYPGLEQKLNNLNYEDTRMLRLIEMSNGLENTGDIMNELLTNPQKLSVVLSEVINQPYLAHQQLMSLSNSIKVNQTALADEVQANAPMSQLKPSTHTGMADSKDVSVQDLRRMLSAKR